MRPYLLKGHSRPLTHVKFNREGDLLFTAAKDHTPCVWYSHNGERLGTFNGHNGTVYALDIDFHTTRLITASADRSVKLWDIETGTELFSFPHKSMVRSVGWSEGDRMILTAQDQSFSQQPTVFIYNIEADVKDQTTTPIRELKDPTSGKVSTALWSHLNHKIICGCQDGAIRLWDVETGTLERKVEEHKLAINHVCFSHDKTMFITASADRTAKLWDSRTCKALKTYQSDRPLNGGAISPILPHVIVGGGQDAMDVTTTDSRVGHFETDFFHMVYSDKLGSVKGHFGPINTVAFAPDGRSFASGAEDGYIRLHHFDKEYFDSPKW